MPRDPAKGFLPSIGRLEAFDLGDAVRIDTGVEEGADISPFYDPMIAKLIAHGDTRDDARLALAAALDDTVIWPVRSNAGFLVEALRHPAFAAGEIDTGLIAREGDALMPPTQPGDDALAAAAAALSAGDPLAGFRLNAPARTRGHFLLDGAPIEIDFADVGDADEVAGELLISEGGQTWRFAPFRASGVAAGGAGDGAILSPMPGRVIAVEVAAGDAVTRGQKLVTLEAMKMEHSLVAPFDGVVETLDAAEGRAGRGGRAARPHHRRRDRARMSLALLLVAQVATLSATNYQVDAPMRAPATAPTWRDEFGGTRIDQAKWRYDTAFNKAGWFNHEKQYYAAARPQNARIDHGALVLEARRERLSNRADWGGQDYSSAKLVSRAPRGYGFYEFRAQLPCARGTWPALWLLPRGGTWPDEGEIDVMEMVGWDANVVHATLHTGAFNHRLGTQRGAQIDVPTACTAWHRYQLDWRRDSITIGMDDRAYMRVANDRPGGKAAWPFTRPYDIILNLAIGGDWGGKEGVDGAALPQAMRVDYVRYWQGR